MRPGPARLSRIRARDPNNNRARRRSGGLGAAAGGGWPWQVDRLGVGDFFGEVLLSPAAAEELPADVISLGATGGVRCGPDGSPLGRRRTDPVDLFRLSRADFDAVAAAYPALEGRLRSVGSARLRRACSPQCSPVRAAGGRGRGSSAEAEAAAPGSPEAGGGAAGAPRPPPAARPERRRLSTAVAMEEEAALRAAEALLATLTVI